jgi:hypothetical protein
VLRERSRDNTEFRAAVRLVLDELGANVTIIEYAKSIGWSPRPGGIGLSDETYRSVRLILARHLPADLRFKLAEVYAPFRVPGTLEAVKPSWDHAGHPFNVHEPNPTGLEASLQEMTDARSRLFPYVLPGRLHRFWLTLLRLPPGEVKY